MKFNFLTQFKIGFIESMESWSNTRHYRKTDYGQIINQLTN